MSSQRHQPPSTPSSPRSTTSPAPGYSSDDSVLSIGVSKVSLKSLTHAATSRMLPRVINAVRFLAADAVFRAKSGHTGMPMGMAPTACTLWDTHLSYNPENPLWINRDRFVLSAGHGSMLLYSLLHLYGYDSISIDDIKNFRKLGSRAAGHPENVLTPGVEVTTGALGQGIANAVGMALAETHLAAVYNQSDCEPVIDHFTYCIVGDGCLMEGISSEVCSLAGHWRLGKLIVIYDDNQISIEGSTDLAFTEDVSKRFMAQGWHVIEVLNGNSDINSIHNAIIAAKGESEKPSLIKVTTTIGYGTPTLAGTAAMHGPCLDAVELQKAKDRLDWKAKPFDIPDDIMTHTRRKKRGGAQLEGMWRAHFHKYSLRHPKLAARFKREVIDGQLPDAFLDVIDTIGKTAVRRDAATRKLSGSVLNALADVVPSLIGGSADLGPSTVTLLQKFGHYEATSRDGRNLHFGVREHGMGSICNGIALHGSQLIPFCSTFLVFSDYCRAAIRTAALSRAQVLYILTHDSVFVGEDGPTHQPIEHVASLRAMPGLFVFRPADEAEVAAAYKVALNRRDGPTCLIMSRQAFNTPVGSGEGTSRGGYIHTDNTLGDDEPDVVLISTGSEMGLVSEAADQVRLQNVSVRVVSMPCVELFQAQSRNYRSTVLGGRTCRSKTLAVEAGSSLGWYQYAEHVMGINEFGLSAPSAEIRIHFGMTVETVIDRVLSIVKGEKNMDDAS